MPFASVSKTTTPWPGPSSSWAPVPRHLLGGSEVGQALRLPVDVEVTIDQDVPVADGRQHPAEAFHHGIGIQQLLDEPPACFDPPVAMNVWSPGVGLGVFLRCTDSNYYEGSPVYSG